MAAEPLSNQRESEWSVNLNVRYARKIAFHWEGVDGGENPRIDGAVVKTGAYFAVEPMAA